MRTFIQSAVVRSLISGFKVWRNRGEGLRIPFFWFIDDILLFCEANHNRLLYVRWTLLRFEAVLGLKINLEKSELILVGRVGEY